MPTKEGSALSSIDLSKIDLGKISKIDFNRLVKSVDMRPEITQMGIGVRSQNGRGTCSVFASTFLLEFMLCKERGLSSIDLSEEYLNAVTNRATGRTDDGDFFSNIWEGYKAFGVVSEVWCPYKTTYNPSFQPDEELMGIGKATRFFKTDLMYSANIASNKPGLSDVQLAAILKQLDNGVPVAIGFYGSGGTTTVSIGGLSVWDDLSNDVGSYGHSVPIVGYRAGILPGGGYVIFRNSGGPNWGDAGYGYMTFNYVKKYTYDVVVYARSPQFLPAHVPPSHVVERFQLPYITPHLFDKLGKLIHPGSYLK